MPTRISVKNHLLTTAVAVVTVIQPEMVPPEKWGNLIAVTSMVMVMSSVLGPILGGVINGHSSWRWVFLLKSVKQSYHTLPRRISPRPG